MTGTGTGRIEYLAGLLAAARRGGPKVDAAAGTGLTRAEAFAVQQCLAEEFGPVGGFKVACPPDAPIIIAPIFASDIRQSPATLSVPAGEPVGVEMEYAFRLTAPLPDTSADGFKEHLGAVVELLPAFELVQSRLADPTTADPLLKMADNQINGGIVLGHVVPDWRELDVTRALGWLKVGNNILLDGPAQVPGGDAFKTLCKLATAIGTHCGGLQAGQVVITGSLNGLPWITAGLTVEGRIDGLGHLKMTLDPA